LPDSDARYLTRLTREEVAMTTREIAVATLGPLFSTALSAERFAEWKVENRGIVEVFDECILGEIYWHKTLRRPKTATLSEGFILLVWIETHVPLHPNGTDGTLVTLNRPPPVRLFAAKDDADFWRVAYVVSDVPPGHHGESPPCPAYDDPTHIVPVFAKVQWDVPLPPHSGDYLGFRNFVPYEISLVKELGAAHQSIQVVHSHLLPAHVQTPFDTSP
jgi:hypothetical protein